MRKKQNLTLDFTCLLDVILILLFIVIIGANEASIKSNASLQSQLDENSSYIEELLNENKLLSDELNELNNDDFSKQIKEMTKVMMICDTKYNANTKNNEVIIKVYIKEHNETQELLPQRITWTHEEGLSYSERKLLISNQINEVGTLLKTVLQNDDTSMFWFMIQYDYDDKNFTHSDLEILDSAINNVSLHLSKACYVEEIKLD